MKKLILALIMSCLYIFTFAQGISFSRNLNWQDILQKARAEKKSIFVDCFTTWCGPCKLMDEQVYPNDTIGRFMNDYYISVKLQMDRTNQDSSGIQEWYGTAHDFEARYSVLAYPSFLFFSPDGLIVQKDIGVKSVQDFLRLAKSALDPRLAYSKLVSEYEQGKLKYADMVELANNASNFKESDFALKVAKDYIENYLDSLTVGMILVKDNLNFMTRYSSAVTSNDNSFRLFFKNRKKIDSIMDYPGYTNYLINSVIYAENITPETNTALAEHREPDWGMMEKKIRRNYGREYMNVAVLRGRVEFYKANKNWRQYAKYLVLRYEGLGIRKMPVTIGTAFLLNDKAFEIFTYSSNKKDLRIALSWVNLSIQMQDNHPDAATVDTKANLLYKLGKRDEGIALEKKAVDQSPDDKELQETYSKMQKGMATWIM